MIHAEARAKAEAEAASKAAKEAGLGARLDAANDRIAKALHPHPASSLALPCLDDALEANDAYFVWGWQKLLHTEENVTRFESHAAQIERDATEAKRKQLARDTFQPRFEAFRSRVEALGLTIEFGDEKAGLGDYWSNQSYSDEGIVAFVADLDKREREAAKTKAEAEAEAVYQL